MTLDSAPASAVGDLRRSAYEVAGQPALLAVPEHQTKAALAATGIAVPNSFVVTGEGSGELPATLLEPLAVKAFGPGIVHKSDLGAVALDQTHDSLAEAMRTISTQLHAHQLTPAGFLVEEQAAAGSELIVGVVRRDPYGMFALLGVGGVFTELIDRTALAPFPLSEADAERLVDQLPAAVLAGARGRPPVERADVVHLLRCFAGADGLAAALGDELLELECNPVIANEHGLIAADARLILAAEPKATPSSGPPTTDFTSLFAPKRIAVAGASRTKQTFGNRFLAAYREAGWTDGLFALHPTADDIDGVPAVGSVAEIPGGVDYLLSAVPAAATPGIIRQNGPHTQFAQVVSGGFSEAGPAGAEREEELLAAVHDTGLRLLGPNCMGVYSPAGRQTFLAGPPTSPGGVSVLSQSGGLSGDIIRAGSAAGLRFAHVASLGNSGDVAAGEMLSWLALQAETQVIGCYVEGIRDGRFVEALATMAGNKPVVLLIGGLSRQGAVAVASHTGSLAGDSRLWEALARSLGVTIVQSLEEFVATLAYHQHHAGATDVAPADPGVVVVGPGGGAAVLATDAFDRAGLDVVPFDEALVNELRGLGYGAGTSVTNPVEIPIGPAVPLDSFQRVLAPILAHRTVADAALHVNVSSYYSFGDHGIAPLRELLIGLDGLDWGPTRGALVLRNLTTAGDGDAASLRAAARGSGLAVFERLGDCATAIAAAQRFDGARARCRQDSRRIDD